MVVVIIIASLNVPEKQQIDFGESGVNLIDIKSRDQLSIHNNTENKTYSNVIVRQFRDGGLYWQSAGALLGPNTSIGITDLSTETLEEFQKNLRPGDIFVISAEGLQTTYSYAAIADPEFEALHPTKYEADIGMLHYVKLKPLGSSTNKPEAVETVSTNNLTVVSQLTPPSQALSDVQPANQPVVSDTDRPSTDLYFLGMTYWPGNNFTANADGKDPVKAVMYFQQAADKGLVSAQEYVGYAYWSGIGVSKDLAKSVEYFQKASDGGSDLAGDYLGLAYQEGYGVDIDLTKAAEYFQNAADRGNSDAQKHLWLLKQSR
jgi:hypothetical protein